MTSDDISWVPADVDLTRPNAARVYDYLLGGGCNFDIDRKFADEVLEVLPEAREATRLNRGFLRRAVRYCAEQGVRQFLDLGAGIPTVGPTHEIAAAVHPGSKVLYVDNEAVAVAHSKLLLEHNANAAMLQEDARVPEAILHAPETRQLLDFDQPIAVMMLALLHFMPDAEDPAGLVASYRDALAPGSYLILSHVTQEGRVGARTEDAVDKYRRTANTAYVRDRDQVLRFFDGFELVEPGVVFTQEWRPETAEEAGETSERSLALAGVGRKTS